MRDWICFFSQVGSEINQIIDKTGFLPKKIITNREGLKGTVLDKYRDIIVFLPKKPTVSDYLNALYNEERSLITLHGYLRIIPKDICDRFEIYKGHLGLITKYPELIGFNPQQRAYELKLKTSRVCNS